MALTSRNYSVLGEEEQKSVPPVKKQGQGAGASEGRNSITEGDELEMDLTPAAEAADEAKMMEQMRATNQIAEQLMQQEAQTADLKKKAEEREVELQHMIAQLDKSREDLVSAREDAKHYKILYDEINE
jgi:hypothetical protein